MADDPRLSSVQQTVSGPSSDSAGSRRIPIRARTTQAGAGQAGAGQAGAGQAGAGQAHTAGLALRAERVKTALLFVAILLLGYVAGRGRRLPEAKAQPGAGAATVVPLESKLIDAIAKAEKSVVAIARIRKDNNVFDGSRPAEPRNQVVTATDEDFVPNEYATGVVIDPNGLILTNYHVLGNPTENFYWVWIQQKPYKVTGIHRLGKVIAGDPWTDLAILKIDAANLTPVTLGNAKEVRKGQIVVALGNPYAIARDGQPSASWGIIANRLRTAPARQKSLTDAPTKETLHHYGTLLQTDARLNLGTSGGALINLEGELVGLTTSQAALTGYETPAGYAIPVDDTFRRVLRDLKAGKRTDFGFLGLATEQLAAADRRRGRSGALVRHVIPGTPAHKAGFKPKDVIVEVHNETVHGPNDVSRQVGRAPAGAQIEMMVLRGQDGATKGRPRRFLVTLSKQFVELQGPVISQQSLPVWRGVRVDFATAVPPQVLRERNHLIDPAGCVAVRAVATGSPAWNAGLREGEFITHVNSKRVTSPKAFFELAAAATGKVDVRISSTRVAKQVAAQ